MAHYQVPPEFIRQKTTILWFVTLEHAVAAFAGYLLGEALGGGSLATLVCVAGAFRARARDPRSTTPRSR